MDLFERGIYTHWISMIDVRLKIFVDKPLFAETEQNEFDYFDLSLLRLSGTFYLLLIGTIVSIIAFIREITNIRKLYKRLIILLSKLKYFA